VPAYSHAVTQNDCVRQLSARSRGMSHLRRRCQLATAHSQVFEVVPGLQELLCGMQPAVVQRVAFLGSDVEVQRADRLGGNEDGAPNRTRVVDIGGVLITDQRSSAPNANDNGPRIW
jgi:hypothetical protein